MTSTAVANWHNRKKADLRVARGAFVEKLLRDKRWTIRSASLAIGISNSALGDRVKGRVAFLADELEVIATLVDMEPVAFYREYIAVDEKGPVADAHKDHATGAAS